MNGAKPNQSLKNLARALDRLGEALAAPESDSLIIDATIQRFEFTIELFWKTFRRLLLEQGIETTTPRETLEEAYAAKWFSDDELWHQMLLDRNKTSHIYDEEMARRIYENVRLYYPEMRRIFENLTHKYGTL
ncbi:MAG: HI0074 family nucleotidyltransferase substrate-binding subunit [Candidatus Sumerlaeota bacterium]|nr:HI0074 family nucleotidyltransferase substrate-binding subunit [Candidatus Sumerlaeota bacterium]